MARWTFEPGHTAAEFRARHMMVTYVRGHFKDVHGTLEFDPANPRNSSVEVKIDARNIWTGVKERDETLSTVSDEEFTDFTYAIQLFNDCLAIAFIGDRKKVVSELVRRIS